jgi:hypothetical protein
MTSGQHRRIAVCFVEWATAGMQAVVVDWTVIGSDDAARSFGGRLVEAPRSFVGSTAISCAIDFSVRQLERAPFTSDRRVIDISGDGNNNSGRSVTDARDDALAKSITINCPGDSDATRRIFPSGAHQSAGWPREILPGQRHRRPGHSPSLPKATRLSGGPHEEADPGDRRSSPHELAVV